MKMCRRMIIVNYENGLFMFFVFLKSGIPKQACCGREIIEKGLLYTSYRMLLISCLECNSAEGEFWGLRNGVAENSVPFRDVTLRR
jgi:hypothetical protein